MRRTRPEPLIEWVPGPDGILRARLGVADSMLSPVLCRCGEVYDTAKVTVTARYADCSMWRSPCCGALADDRTWTHQPYTRLDTERPRR